MNDTSRQSSVVLSCLTPRHKDKIPQDQD